MKKMIKSLLVLVLFVPLVACQKNETEIEIEENIEAKEVVETYFNYLMSGDTKKAQELLATGYTQSSQLIPKQEDSLWLVDITLQGDAYVEAGEQFLSYYISKIVKEYEITEITENEGNAFVTVKGKRIDFDYYETSNKIMNKSFDLIEEYKNLHLTELSKYSKANGLEATLIQIYTGISNDMITFAKEQIDAITTYGDFTTEFKLVKENDTYLISMVADTN